MKWVQAKLHANIPATMSLFLLKCDGDAIQMVIFNVLFYKEANNRFTEFTQGMRYVENVFLILQVIL